MSPAERYQAARADAIERAVLGGGRVKLTREMLWHDACAVSPTWIADGAWMIRRSLIDEPPKAVLDSAEAIKFALNPPHGIEILPDDERFAKVLGRTAEATVEHEVTDWILRGHPELVRLLPVGVIRRPIVEAFNLWGAKLLSATADGRSPYYQLANGAPQLIVMGCRPETRFRFPQETAP